MSNEIKSLTKRATAAFGALGLGAALTVAALLAPHAPMAVALTASGGQVQTRAIYMSTSRPGATAQSYLVSFKPATTGTLEGIVVDFCSNDPIAGDTCTAPNGFSVGTPTVNFGATSAGNPTTTGTTALPGTWTPSAAHTNRTLKLDNATGSSLTAGTLYGFTITTVTNPDATNTSPSFYARVLTYATDGTDFTNYDGGTEGTVVDYGGFALSTAATININVKVQETLLFCVVTDTTDPGTAGHTCSDSVYVTGHTPDLTIGHGTNVKIIDNSQIDTATAFMQVSTNATSGAVIRMHAANACANGGLSSDSGTTCAISGLDNTTAGRLVTATPNTGNAEFGLYVGNGYATTGVATSTTNITADPNYHNASNVTEPSTIGGPLTNVNDLWFGLDNTTNSGGVTGTYGDTIATTGGAPCNTTNAHLVFGAIASLTTPAGIYQGVESLIATGTF